MAQVEGLNLRRGIRVRKVLSFIDRISTFTGKAVSILTLFAAAAIVYEIVVRNWFHRPTVWAA